MLSFFSLFIEHLYSFLEVELHTSSHTHVTLGHQAACADRFRYSYPFPSEASYGTTVGLVKLGNGRGCMVCMWFCAISSHGSFM